MGSLATLAWNLALEAELVRILALLDPLEVISFKGPLLTRQIFGDLRLRLSSDNDLLVRNEDDALQAVRRLCQDGYAPLPYDIPERTLRRTGRVTLLKQTESMLHAVDLHVGAFDKAHFSVGEGVVREHLETFEVHGRKVQTFDRQLAFAHLVSHFIQHRFEDHVLRDMGAAWSRWQSELGGDAFRKLAARTCTVEAFEYSVAAARELGYSEGPAVAASRARTRWVLRAFPPQKILEPAHQGYLRGFWSTVLVNPGAVPGLAWRGVVLPEYEYEVRHQAKYRPSMRLHRLEAPLLELRARWASLLGRK